MSVSIWTRSVGAWNDKIATAVEARNAHYYAPAAVGTRGSKFEHDVGSVREHDPRVLVVVAGQGLGRLGVQPEPEPHHF